jgi:hypothetical protein
MKRYLAALLAVLGVVGVLGLLAIGRGFADEEKAAVASALRPRCTGRIWLPRMGL